MNENFETIRKDLKKYNAEENSVPPKLVVTGKTDFLDIEHKRAGNSQFIIGMREYAAAEEELIQKMLNDIELRSGRKPLVFYYDDWDILDGVIDDFKDYYNAPLKSDVFEKAGPGAAAGQRYFVLAIVIAELYYYKA